MTANGEEFEAFCRREHPILVRSLAIQTGSVGVAEELAQEALARAYARWATVRTLDRPGAWVQRVAFNLAASRFRRLGAERRALARSSPAHGGASDDADGITVRDAVARLPQRQRAAVVLRYWLGMSGDEAAAVLGTSSANVHQLCHRAVASLRRDLGVALPDPTSEEPVRER